MSKKSKYLSRLYVYHYFKLAFRTVLFTVALILYIINRTNLGYVFHAINYKNKTNLNCYPVSVGLVSVS